MPAPVSAIQLNNWTVLPYSGSNIFPGVIYVQTEAKTNANQANLCDIIKSPRFISLTMLAV